jgi:hypothetical protein
MSSMSNEARKGLTGPLGPISWGLSQSFLASVTRTLLFGAFPDRLDPRDWMNAGLAPELDWSPWLRPGPSGAPEGCEELWFDYVADTGDSLRGTYSVAYLLHGDLFANAGRGALVGRAPSPLEGVEVTTQSKNGYTRLPAGAFLLIGGDLAYAIADDQALRERLVAPFDLARQHRGAGAARERLLFAIPGNHDWYDSLDGFNRLVRAPAPGSARPAIALEGFRAVQQASYVALDLPFGWSLWGVDALSEADVDRRQRAHFGGRRPEQLILVTPAPLIAFDEPRPWAGALLDLLGLELRPAPGEARLYLSGDSHHYARYQVPGGGPGRDGATSVVCGLGGASLHPPRNHPGELRPAEVFPTPRDARKEVLRQTLHPLRMIFKSGFAPFGLFIGAFLGAGLAAFRGEISGILRQLGLLRFGAEGLPPPGARDLWPRTLMAAGLLVAGALVFRAFWKWRVARSEGQARRRSKLTRAVMALSALGVGGALAVMVAVLFGGAERSALSVALDLLVYGVLGLGSVGLGIITLALGDVTNTWSGTRKAATVLTGTVVGGLFLAAAGLALLRGLDALAEVPLVAGVVRRALLLDTLGTAAYLAAILLGALLGAAVGGLLFPVLFGLHISAQYLLGNQYMFPGSLARVDRYQAFIRFRLRRYRDGGTELTGFVVGVDRPASDEVLRGKVAPDHDASAPRARVADVFSLSGRAEGRVG